MMIHVPVCAACGKGITEDNPIASTYLDDIDICNLHSLMLVYLTESSESKGFGLHAKCADDIASQISRVFDVVAQRLDENGKSIRNEISTFMKTQEFCIDKLVKDDDK